MNENKRDEDKEAHIPHKKGAYQEPKSDQALEKKSLDQALTTTRVTPNQGKARDGESESVDIKK